MIVLDTDICIGLLRGNRHVIERRRRRPDDVAVSFMTVGELFYGAEKSSAPEANRDRVERFLLTVIRLDSDFEILRRFGQEKARLQRDGLLLPDADLLIAVTALRYRASLSTGNTRHFERFPGLRIEDWTHA